MESLLYSLCFNYYSIYLNQAAACGTAVVVTPVNKIVYGEKVISLSEGVGTY